MEEERSRKKDIHQSYLQKTTSFIGRRSPATRRRRRSCKARHASYTCTQLMLMLRKLPTIRLGLVSSEMLQLLKQTKSAYALCNLATENDVAKRLKRGVTHGA